MAATLVEIEQLERARRAQPKLMCRLCQSRDLQLMFKLPPTPAANAFMKTPEEAKALPVFPLEVNRCGNCGHCQLGHVVDSSYLFGDYAYTTGSSPALVAHFEALARLVVAEAQVSTRAAQPLVLEIGSNDGTFLQACQKQGAAVIGIEPAATLAAQANDRGVRTWSRFFDQSTAQTVLTTLGPIDAWVATNVMAHIDDLLGTLKALRSCSGPATIGCVEVQYVGKLLEHGLFDMIYHEHLDYHGMYALGRALTAQGWHVQQVDEIATHGGSLRFWVCATDKRAVAVEDALTREVTRDLPAEWAALEMKRADAANKLIGQLRGPRVPRWSWDRRFPKRVLCYGAPAKLTTLMYGLGLHDWRINEDFWDFQFIGVIDDAPSKQWRYTPGMGLPILPATALRDEKYKPDAVLVTAWNYAEGITTRIRAAGLSCPIIVPFSE